MPDRFVANVKYFKLRVDSIANDLRLSIQSYQVFRKL